MRIAKPAIYRVRVARLAPHVTNARTGARPDPLRMIASPPSVPTLQTRNRRLPHQQEANGRIRLHWLQEVGGACQSSFPLGASGPIRRSPAIPCGLKSRNFEESDRSNDQVETEHVISLRPSGR